MAPKLFEEEQRFFEANVRDNPKIHHAIVDGVHYARSEIADQPTLLFIHGTPGNWQFASRYMLDDALLTEANVVAIDRPGWGRSILDSEGNKVLRFAEQSERLEPLLKAVKQLAPEQPLVLVGHSLGASLSPQLALDYPDLVDGMVLVAGALAPDLGRPRWYNLAASMGVVSWALGQGMRKANREIMPLHDDLAALEARWQDLDIPVMVVQGMEDGLVYPENADYAERAFADLPLRMVRLPDVGHLIPWQHRELLTEYLRDFLQSEFSSASAE